MSRHIGIFYRCDKCGAEERPGFECDWYTHPCGWTRIGKLHFCRECRILAERLVEREKQGDSPAPTLKIWR